jgi:hypothetical protein
MLESYTYSNVGQNAFYNYLDYGVYVCAGFCFSLES